MQVIRRFLNCLVVFLLCNIILLWNIPNIPGVFRVVAICLLPVLFVWINIRPLSKKSAHDKFRSLGGGCELLGTAAFCAAVMVVASLIFSPFFVLVFGQLVWVFNIVFSRVALTVLVLNGTIRLLISSKQLTATHRILFLLFWWVPIVNIAIISVIFFVARKEYRFTTTKISLNQRRISQQVCKTKYPLLMVHGIFFRDWEMLGYWGRIPAELEANGSVLYYGHQQSSSSIESSAAELKNQILRIVEDTSCEKVNIIAHSKGGLDARYAISCLGMDKHVASLTTICAPHHGCRFAKQALDNVPKNIVAMVSTNYNKLFTALGDDHPDFFSGVSELSDEKCLQLNEQMPDCADVLYQSVGARMKAASSAIFPLNLGFSIINAIDGKNDGLVAVHSMPWGDFTMLEPTGRRGISHADMIDLTRKDVSGFDVREFYVGMVKRLKERGL